MIEERELLWIQVNLLLSYVEQFQSFSFCGISLEIEKQLSLKRARLAHRESKVTVKGGYSPDVISIKEGRPIRLNFYRDETSSCSEQVVFGDLGIARDYRLLSINLSNLCLIKAANSLLPAVMNMLRGKLIVE